MPVMRKIIQARQSFKSSLCHQLAITAPTRPAISNSNLSILSSRRCRYSMRSTPWGMFEIGQPRRHSLLGAKGVAGPKMKKPRRMPRLLVELKSVVPVISVESREITRTVIWIEHTTCRNSGRGEAKASPPRNPIYNDDVAIILHLQVSAIRSPVDPIPLGCPGTTTYAVDQKGRALHVEASDQIFIWTVVYIRVGNTAISLPDWDAVIVES